MFNKLPLKGEKIWKHMQNVGNIWRIENFGVKNVFFAITFERKIFLAQNIFVHQKMRLLA